MLAFCMSAFAKADIGGFWKAVNEKTGKANCIVAVYQYQGIYYGRIIGTYNQDGVMDDTIYAPVDRAPGVRGNPFYCGLDFIWGLREKGGRFMGKILDPKQGDVYNAELWVKQGNLIVRGKLLFFGRNQEWLPATASDFPKGFQMPNVAAFVPSIPDGEG